MIDPTGKCPGMFTTREPFVLASASPRRRELLHGLGLQFDVFPSDGVEWPAHGSPGEQVRVWARRKVQSVCRRFPDRWVLGADTIVVLGGAVFGKPLDREDAARCLRELSGRTHEVMTAVCLAHAARHVQFERSVRTQVTFKELSSAEIDAYVDTGEPYDKAGAYGIQGMGACLVRSIHGSYTNVVGLPLCETLEWICRFGIAAPTTTRAL